MIEVLISARIQGEVGLKKRGDILVAKLAESPWGRLEKGAVCDWTDTVLETELNNKKANGEAFPVVALPYSEYEKIVHDLGDGETLEELVIVNRSKIYVDIDSLDMATRTRIESRDFGDAPIDERSLTTKTRTGTSVGGTLQPSRTAPATRNRSQ